MDDDSPSTYASHDAVDALLLAEVVAPLVRQLRDNHGADVAGEVRPGRDTERARGSSAAGTGPDRWSRDTWTGARIAMTGENGVELPLAHPGMEYDDVIAYVEYLISTLEDWYACTGAGWGQRVDLDWPKGFTRTRWDRAAAEDRAVGKASP